MRDAHSGALLAPFGPAFLVSVRAMVALKKRAAAIRSGSPITNTCAAGGGWWGVAGSNGITRPRLSGSELDNAEFTQHYFAYASRPLLRALTARRAAWQ